MEKKETLQCFPFVDNIIVRMMTVCACVFVSECVSFAEEE